MTPQESQIRRVGVSGRQPEPKTGRSHRLHRRRRDAGFTLVEVFITVAMILTLAAIALPNMMAAMTAAKTAKAVGDIHAMEDDIALYETINNALPDDLSQCVDTTLVDPWGNPYQYLNHTDMKGNGQARKDRFLTPLNSDYDLYSMGPDGASSPPITAKPSQDDILRASDGSFVGVAADF